MSNQISSKQAFLNAKYFSTKHDSYFKVYDRYAAKIKSKAPLRPTIVEVGILHGGSLFMWREIFGPQARIIGVDLNPEALKWAEHGFEIFVGNQASTNFWENFYNEVGRIDFFVDDGGHTNRQQIVTTVSALANMNPGGIVIVEDTDTSFSKEFGNPSRFSFLNFSKNYIDSLYSSTTVGKHDVAQDRNLDSVTFFESMVVFEIKEEENLKPISINNSGIRDSASDFRYEDLGLIARKAKLVMQWSDRRVNNSITRTTKGKIERIVFKILSLSATFMFRKYVMLRMKLENLSLRFYWRK